MTFGKTVGIICFVISLIILWKIRQVLLLAFAAIVLATAINRIVKTLQKQGMKRGVAVGISVFFILLVIAGFFSIIVPPVIDQWQQLIQQVPVGFEQLKTWYLGLQDFIPNQFFGELQSPESLFEQISNTGLGLFNNVFSFFSTGLGITLNIILVMAVTIMLLSNPTPYRRNFILIFPAFYRPRVNEILNECEQNVVGSLIGLLFNMTVITILSGVGLWILGVRLALVNALLAGFLTFIPNIGPTISVIPPALLALLDSPLKALAVVGLYIAIQQIESNILTPLVMKREVSLLPAVTLLSQVTFTIFFGTLGLLLAIPLVAVLQVWFREMLVKDVMNQYD
ncbi:AI-2E family transporter [Capilliphycus salinus ALCB114379]|uniref:AI-2E family transporter n=1 Tax=Capilliphycus salinus TaxID=2768948 RepID=UPI0039A5A146